MKSNREQAISETLKWEGGYSDNPKDPGGPTNWGITLHDAQAYWKHDATAADVKRMPKAVAVSIYQTKYWKTPQYDCDNLSAGVDLAVFDFGVNSGPARAKNYLLKSIGGTDEETINKLCDYRLAFLKSLHTWPTFGKGWSRRVEGIREVALKMALLATEKPTDASNDDEGTQDTPDLGNRMDEAKTWWDRLKDWGINWKAVGRQLSVLASMTVGFITDHKIIFGIIVVLIAAYALWNSLGRPQFWKPWKLPQVIKYLRGKI